MLFAVILFGMSLCADCFAVSLCSGVTLRSSRWKDILFAALVFAVIQTAFLFLGWALGHAIVSLVIKIARWIGFLLLLYVGGSMVIEGVRHDNEARDLSSFRNLVIGGIATSIDAFSVGVSMAMGGDSVKEILPKAISVFVFTVLSVIAGIAGGKKIGGYAGPVAEIIGGLVLVGIGISILLK